jgi:hypothetical protein
VAGAIINLYVNQFVICLHGLYERVDVLRSNTVILRAKIPQDRRMNLLDVGGVRGHGALIQDASGELRFMDGKLE